MERERKKGGGRGGERESYLRLFSPLPSSLFLLSPHFARVQNCENRSFSEERHGNACYAGFCSRPISRASKTAKIGFLAKNATVTLATQARYQFVFTLDECRSNLTRKTFTSLVCMIWGVLSFLSLPSPSSHFCSFEFSPVIFFSSFARSEENDCFVG